MLWILKVFFEIYLEIYNKFLWAIGTLLWYKTLNIVSFIRLYLGASVHPFLYFSPSLIDTVPFQFLWDWYCKRSHTRENIQCLPPMFLLSLDMMTCILQISKVELNNALCIQTLSLSTQSSVDMSADSIPYLSSLR